MKAVKLGFLEAARNLEEARLDASRSSASVEERELRWHLSGEPLVEAAIKAISFLAPFEYEIVEVQEPKPGNAPDWVVVRDAVTQVALRFDLLDDVLIRPQLVTRYPASGSGYKLSIVIPRSGWHMKSAFRQFVGHQWKAVRPVAIESFRDLEAASAEYNRIVDSRLRDANG